MKPANLMLTPASGKTDTTWNATVKILDIGLGRELFDESSTDGQIDTQLTAEGTVLGTPDYLAPEQARDARNADIRADIYSLGCVLYHCLTGQTPFPETNLMAQMLKHARDKPAPLASLAADVPSGLQAVVDRMLAKSPDDRYATPAQAAEALVPFLGSGGIAPEPAALVPEFRAWLETESHLEMPANLLPDPTGTAVPVKPGGTGPAPAYPAAAGPIKPGTAPAPVLAANPKPGTGTSRSLTAGTAPMPAAPAKPTRPGPARPAAPPRPPVEDEVDVELVVEPAAGPALLPPPPVQIVKVKDDRGLLEFDRRDWIMLASGAACVLAAVGIGYGLARIVRKKPEEQQPEE
jgi:hypothetical protein